MAKYVLVKKEPKSVDKDCIIIGKLDFLNEIEQCSRKKPRSMMMSINYLREIISTIGLKYGPDDFNPLSSVNVSPYRGISCKTDEETQRIVIKAFKKSYPDIFSMYMDYQIRHRPEGTKLIYFAGDPANTAAFQAHGIDSLPEKEVDFFLGKKTKKIIGKPAITKEDAKNLK